MSHAEETSTRPWTTNLLAGLKKLSETLPASEGHHDHVSCKIGDKVEGSFGDNVHHNHQENGQPTPEGQKIQHTVASHGSKQLVRPAGAVVFATA